MRDFKSNTSFKPDNKPTKKSPVAGTRQELHKKPINPTRLLSVKKLDFPTSNKPPFC